jgi:hypothetical protein
MDQSMAKAELVAEVGALQVVLLHTLTVKQVLLVDPH